MKIFDETFNGIEKAMDMRFKRHVLLASNVANSETPKYRARELDFAGQLEKAFEAKPTSDIAKTDSRHMDVSMFSGEHVVMDNSGAMGDDGNNVDLDIMMGRVGDNYGAYAGAANLISQKFRFIKQFVRRGG